MDLVALEKYHDASLRRVADAEPAGSFTVFVARTPGRSYYARPVLDPADPFDAVDVAGLLVRMRDLGVREVLAWTHEVTPTLLAAVLFEGSLGVEELPLMLLAETSPAPRLPAGVKVRMLGPEDGHLLTATSGVRRLAFGPARDWPAGVGDRDAAGAPPSAQALAELRDGTVRIAVAEHPGLGVLATGQHVPCGGYAEIAGVGVLPAEQGRGLGSAITRALAADATALGVRTVFLAAASDRVARIYARLGFLRVGTGYAAARDAGDVPGG